MARKFVGTVEKVDNVGTFGAETSAKSVESAHLTSFTVECMAKPSVIAWQVPISKDGEPGWVKHGWVDQSFCVKFRNESPTDHKINFQFWDANTNMVVSGIIVPEPAAVLLPILIGLFFSRKNK